MKTKNIVVAFFFALLTTGAFAQNLNGVQRGQRGYTPPPLEQEKKARAVENTLANINEKMDMYEAEFSLDAFEKAVMRNMIVEFEEGRMATMGAENMEYEVRIQTIQKLQEKLSTDLEVFLTEEEIGRFGELHFLENKGKKKKKKKKDRKS